MRKAEGLAVYMYEGCPYCERVRRAAAKLGLDLEERDIHQERTWLNELRAARGRTTVPVLRIEGEGGPRWMPESADIVRFLEATYG